MDTESYPEDFKLLELQVSPFISIADIDRLISYRTSKILETLQVFQPDKNFPLSWKFTVNYSVYTHSIMPVLSQINSVHNPIPYIASLIAALIQGGSNMTGTNCDLITHNQSRSYLNHLVLTSHLRLVLPRGFLASYKTNLCAFSFIVSTHRSLA
jgi:hypothetical protein